jgi:hypothetical protein
MMPKKEVAITGIWLRRLNDRAEVLAEVNGEWRLVIAEYLEGNFSHIAEGNGAPWKPDPLEDRLKAVGK